MPGPVPKRTEVRRRRNKSEVPTIKAPSMSEVRVPEADPRWHPIALEWFGSLNTSGMRQFFEDSDWAYARYVAEAMHRGLDSDRFSAVLFAAVSSAMDDLGVTEGSRRRLRIELQRGAPEESPGKAAVRRLRGQLRVLPPPNAKPRGRTKLA